MNKLLIAVLAALAFVSCNNPEKTGNNEEGLSVFNADSLVKHIKVLSSDSFQGRKPFTEGETKTIAYLQEQFQSIGVQPGNGDSYLQDVPMIDILSQPAPLMQVTAAKADLQLQGFDEYVLSTPKTDALVSLQNVPVVFAGYGVVAPEYNWNDYAGLDVKGKIVMVLVNDPGFNNGDTTLFKGKTMTYYGRWTYKFEEAARQGARGCLVIHSTAAASYPFSVVQNGWNESELRLDNKNEKLLDAQGWISMEAAKKLIVAGGQDTGIIAKADIPGFKAVTLNETVSTSIRTKVTYSKSHNVIARITGSKYPDEYILYTAHWDHLGIGKPDAKGDSVYNGALDNASGTAALLEFARAWKSLKTPPERTIVFLAVTAEEQGLLGSAYYAQHPVYPVAKTVAVLNVDEVNNYGKTKDIMVVGQGQSDMEDLLKEEAEKQGRYISYDATPEAGHYFRSDHFSFAKAGIPALAQGFGIDVVGKGKEYGKKMQEEFNAQHYHGPSDEYNPSWDLGGATDDLQLLFMVGKRLAYGHVWPGWKAGSEFKAERDRSAAERKE
ncbi:M28 family metallopeptidase [Niabella drilacis]|uniref:Zn-dependent amino-or carboxypeptidase, M28 family n=1 Tax=Niabella drilacis (strain DSM 25811 / CCM 8410 / CCUG 62505 / LMG 26954 / E90) TaxID=1285928 RepID=A0A1G6NIL9_NIADE|nr:M28 family metallopeptidase [Niabella drilacis]SDC67116.1 Zn-dependent amino-or carboxypeptidase, M28 family [Niabella drilacis]